MQYEMLVSVVEELAVLLPGMRVRRVFEGAEGMHLLLHCPGRDLILLIAPERTMPRLYLVTKKPVAVTPPHSMVLYLRSHLSGATVRSVSIVNNDRVVQALFSNKDAEFRLMIELTGSQSNVVLADAASVIQAVYFPLPEVNDRKRPLLAGLTYAPPAARQPRPAMMPLQPENKEDAISSHRPSLMNDTQANRKAELFFEEQVSIATFEQQRNELSSVLAKALARVLRRSDALSAELALSGRAEEFRKAGDLILLNLACLERGREQAELASYDGTVLSVRLDPRYSPTRNAEQYFKKYKKAKSGRAIVLSRLAQAREEAGSLQELQSAVSEASDAATLARIRCDMDARGCRKAPQGAVKPLRAGEPPPFRRTVLRGWEIFVGKNAAGNDYLTTRLARPGDTWLHAEGMPGSHVLVRNPGNVPVPAEVLMKAASYAAFYSKGRGARKVPVTYTLASKVKKPSGAKPGMVVLSERQSVMAVPEELREPRGIG